MRWQFLGRRAPCSGTNVRLAGRVGRAGVSATVAMLVGVFAFCFAFVFVFVVGACAPDDLGGTCHFEGETTNACGECIASSCQTSVDSCCEDSICRESLSLLDRCASGGGCSSVFNSWISMKSISACVKASCASVCGADPSPDVDAGAPVTCSSNDESRTCFCESGQSSDAASVDSCFAHGAGSVCCAEHGWPASGTSCGCAEPACVDYGDGTNCVCGLLMNIYASGAGLHVQSYCAPIDGHCCKKDDGSCTCGASSCSAGEDVGSCLASDVRGSCTGGSTEVRSCH